jgi:hypothetical protein
MQLEFAHVIGSRTAGAGRALPYFDVERTGFGRIIVEDEDGALTNLDIAEEAIAGTSMLDIAIDHRAGEIGPTAAARRFAALDSASGGRLSVRMVTHASVPGDQLSHIKIGRARCGERVLEAG